MQHPSAEALSAAQAAVSAHEMPETTGRAVLPPRVLTELHDLEHHVLRVESELGIMVGKLRQMGQGVDTVKELVTTFNEESKHRQGVSPTRAHIHDTPEKLIASDHHEKGHRDQVQIQPEQHEHTHKVHFKAENPDEITEHQCREIAKILRLPELVEGVSLEERRAQIKNFFIVE
ncbi:hypothetical protein ABW21_db0207876 [Orbilia brochopaga]|nr:hypothetical protein ABW21_db0207876 [Drechslerella brochopaga]